MAPPLRSPFRLCRRRPRLYAHRGARLREPENSLEAFQRALDDGANALELDIQPTADGHFVVMHDPDGRRTAGDRRCIQEVPMDEVKRWALSAPPGSPVGASRSVPTLSEVLQAFASVPLSVDLKPNRPELAGRLIEVITSHGAEDRVTVASFHDRVVHAVRRIGYPGRTTLTRLEAILLRFSPLILPCRLIRGQAAQLPLSSAGVRMDTRGLLERCRRLGLRADFWVVNDPEVARCLLRRGATGVMSDDPARIATVLAELSSETTQPR